MDVSVIISIEGGKNGETESGGYNKQDGKCGKDLQVMISSFKFIEAMHLAAVSDMVDGDDNQNKENCRYDSTGYEERLQGKRSHIRDIPIKVRVNSKLLVSFKQRQNHKIVRLVECWKTLVTRPQGCMSVVVTRGRDIRTGKDTAPDKPVHATNRKPLILSLSFAYHSNGVLQ